MLIHQSATAAATTRSWSHRGAKNLRGWMGSLSAVRAGSRKGVACTGMLRGTTAACSGQRANQRRSQPELFRAVLHTLAPTGAVQL